MITAQIRTYLEIAAVVILGIAIALFIHHERETGAAKLDAADAKALVAAKSQADAQTQLNIERAAKAEAGADHDQQIVNDYRAAHPDGAVRLCHADNSVPGVPAAGGAVGGTQDSGAGSSSLSGVPASVAGPDISGGLAIIVRAASRLAIQDREFQAR